MQSDPYLKHLLLYLFALSRGAEMRAKVIFALADRPCNTNQLAERLGTDYKAAQHHLNILLKNKLITTPEANAYGAVFFLSPLMEEHLDYVREIWKKYGKK